MRTIYDIAIMLITLLLLGFGYIMLRGVTLPSKTSSTSVTTETTTTTTSEEEVNAIRNKPFPLAGMDGEVTNTKSGISGIALLGPTCPVMRNPPDPNCADKPYKGTFILTQKNNSLVHKEFTTANDGTFTVTVPVGEYSITKAPSSSMLPRCADTNSILVTTNQYTDVEISCDTGIR